MKNDRFKLFLQLAIVVFTLSYFDVPILSSIGLLTVAYVGILLVNELGKSIPILELVLFVAGFQWVIGPFLLYRLSPDLTYVPETEYMKITSIAYICFVAGCLFFRKRKAVLNKEEISGLLATKKAEKALKYIFWIGLFFFFVTLVSSSALNFIFSLIYNFAFLAAIMLLYTKAPNRRFYVIFIYTLLFFKGIFSAVFAEFIAQAFLLVIFIPNIYSFGKTRTIYFLVAGMLALTVINTTKKLYRDKVWTESQRDFSFETFFSLLLSTDVYESDDDENAFLTRVSSGITNSLIFSYTPSGTPHTHGEVLLEDFANALIPRFLYPDKQDIDSRKNFMRYTGIYLDDQTSVGVNALGIGYAEFGVGGSYIFMLLYGMLLSFVFNMFTRYSKRNILYLFSIMIVFSIVTKAENEFVGSVNGFIKAIIFVFLFIYFVNRNSPKVFQWKIA